LQTILKPYRLAVLNHLQRKAISSLWAARSCRRDAMRNFWPLDCVRRIRNRVKVKSRGGDDTIGPIPNIHHIQVFINFVKVSYIDEAYTLSLQKKESL
jgi:hypothetical protein